MNLREGERQVNFDHQSQKLLQPILGLLRGKTYPMMCVQYSIFLLKWRYILWKHIWYLKEIKTVFDEICFYILVHNFVIQNPSIDTLSSFKLKQYNYICLLPHGCSASIIWFETAIISGKTITFLWSLLAKFPTILFSGLFVNGCTVLFDLHFCTNLVHIL